MLLIGLLSTVAITFVLSIACGSDSHCVTWFIAYFCSVFCSFSSLHNHSVLLINPEVLYEEMGSYVVRKKLEK